MSEVCFFSPVVLTLLQWSSTGLSTLFTRLSADPSPLHDIVSGLNDFPSQMSFAAGHTHTHTHTHTLTHTLALWMMTPSKGDRHDCSLKRAFAQTPRRKRCSWNYKFMFTCVLNLMSRACVQTRRKHAAQAAREQTWSQRRPAAGRRCGSCDMLNIITCLLDAMLLNLFF